MDNIIEFVVLEIPQVEVFTFLGEIKYFDDFLPISLLPPTQIRGPVTSFWDPNIQITKKWTTPLNSSSSKYPRYKFLLFKENEVFFNDINFKTI